MKLEMPQEKRDRGEPEAASDGTTSHSVKAFQHSNVGNAKERKPSE